MQNFIKIQDRQFPIRSVKVSVEGMRSPVEIRLDSTDLIVFGQVFIYKDFTLPIKLSPKFIIDGGANAGYASIWFSNMFPDADIVAVEPEEKNYILAQQNLVDYPKAKVVKAGIWHRNECLRIVDTHDDGDFVGEWGFQVAASADGKGGVPAVTIEELLKNSGHDEIDILKLDLEGAEKEVFGDNYENWLPKSKVIVVEVHDSLKAGSSESVFSALNCYGFVGYPKGEHYFFVRRDLLASYEDLSYINENHDKWPL